MNASEIHGLPSRLVRGALLVLVGLITVTADGAWARGGGFRGGSVRYSSGSVSRSAGAYHGAHGGSVHYAGSSYAGGYGGGVARGGVVARGPGGNVYARGGSVTTLPAGGVGGYRFAAGAARLATLPSYYHPLYVGGRSYYWYGNTWYAPYVVGGVTYYAEAEAPSEYITYLPAGASSVVINGVTYYVVNGAYYLPTVVGGRSVYMRVQMGP